MRFLTPLQRLRALDTLYLLQQLHPQGKFPWLSGADTMCCYDRGEVAYTIMYAEGQLNPDACYDADMKELFERLDAEVMLNPKRIWRIVFYDYVTVRWNKLIENIRYAAGCPKTGR